MLKRLVIFTCAVILAVCVAGQSNKDAGPNQQPPNQEHPSTHLANGEQSHAKASDNSPAGYASVERSRWWEQSEWWLVAIAGLTGLVIGWQSWETRKAAQGAKENAKVASDQIQMMKDKERARLTIVPIDEGFGDNLREKMALKKGRVKLEHFGSTDAFNVRGYFTMQPSDAIQHPNNANMWHTIKLPAVIRVGSKPIVGEYAYFPFTVEDFEALAKGDMYIVFFGFVLYEDIFGNEHRASFDHYWNVDFSAMEMGMNGVSRWEACDPQKGTGEALVDLLDMFPREENMPVQPRGEMGE
jgi:hypothetical protein